MNVIHKTRAKAMLVEVCFCDHQQDARLYYCAGTAGSDAVNVDIESVNKVSTDVIKSNAADKVAQVIFNSICKRKEELGTAQNQSKEQIAFIEFVGKTAKKDWKERRIMIPSVVIAQAIKESAWGTSELARKANALFGIKENGWQGRIYIKEAAEQKPDGNYYTVADTRWRAYDNWEQSILDHNSYIATRSTDGGKSLRYGPLIGCGDPELVCWYLQRCGYATSITYAESLINDYIVKYDLTAYDGK